MSVKRFYIASLGCPKNTVDSHAMARLLQAAGYESTDIPQEADVLIVNTCGFIAPAREESLSTLQELGQHLRPDQLLIAAGCWAQRDGERLLAQVPQIDGVLGTRSWNAIVPLVERLRARRERTPIIHIERGVFTLPEAAGTAGYAVQGATAFLKIADGCHRQCAFCAIPHIKGTAVSRPLEAILEDARTLQAQGVLELILISQDSTSYGLDLGMRDGLVTLLERLLEEAPEIPWIRVMYAFPGAISPRLIDLMAREPRILPYVDLPLQHAHPAVLRRMRRPDNLHEVRRTVAALRDAIPDVAIRTAFIVGFPGETEEEFQTLLRFVQEMAFDRVGVFLYSHEEGTPAYALADDVPETVKEERRERLMVVQQAISLKRNLRFVGKRLPVLLEGHDERMTVGRTVYDAPEIDGLVLITGKHPVGRIVTVQIDEALVYDLAGHVVTPRHRPVRRQRLG